MGADTEAAAQGRLVVKAAGKQGTKVLSSDPPSRGLILSVQYRKHIEKNLKMKATDCSYLYDERELIASGVQQGWCLVLVLPQRFCLCPVREVANKSTDKELHVGCFQI